MVLNLSSPRRRANAPAVARYTDHPGLDRESVVHIS
jgi:hypothetical protein